MKNYLIVTLFIVVTISGCSTLKTAYDYDKGVDFSSYKTFGIIDEQLAEAVGELNRKRILESVYNEMSAKGIKPSKEADIMVDVRILTQDRVEATATTTGSGYHGYYYGGGFSTTQVTYSEYTDGTLILTIIEKESEKIIWQGAGSKTLNENLSPQKRDETIAYSIKQILKNYPPKE